MVWLIDHRLDLLNKKIELRDSIIDFINDFSIKPKFINEYLEKSKYITFKATVKLKDVLLRPQVNIHDLVAHIEPFKKHISILPENRREEILESAEIFIKYQGILIEKKSWLIN